MKFSIIKKQFILLIGIITITLLFFVGREVLSWERNVQYPEGVYIGDELYTLEYAVTDSEQARGLGEREQLCATCAMAFPFAFSGKHAFWMKNMCFPIDIVWLSRENQVVHIERFLTPESKEIYTPKEVASMVLEFNAGVLDSIVVGDTLRFFSPQIEN